MLQQTPIEQLNATEQKLVYPFAVPPNSLMLSW